MGLTSTPPRIPVIHIGMPKTASKTLQWGLLVGLMALNFDQITKSLTSAETHTYKA